MYDIIFIGEKNSTWVDLNDRFASVKHANSVEEAQRKSLTQMFWAIPSDVNVLKTFKFDYKLDNDKKHLVHQFLNNTEYDGIMLINKNYIISSDDWKNKKFKFFTQVETVASYPKLYDIVFISYYEPTAEENYEKLLKLAPNAKHVKNIKGIHNAHIEAAKQCETEMFWVVDADAIVVDDFDFSYKPSVDKRDHVHVWRCQNPVNGLVYGYGGLKLLPRTLTIEMDTSKPDMTTSITNKFKAMPEISNITAFNIDPFNTWKSAFRECCKLSSKIIDRQKDAETQERLDIWCTKGIDKPFGKYAIDGAIQGKEFGIKNRDNIENLKLINDFNWLKGTFYVRNI